MAEREDDQSPGRLARAIMLGSDGVVSAGAAAAALVDPTAGLAAAGIAPGVSAALRGAIEAVRARRISRIEAVLQAAEENSQAPIGDLLHRVVQRPGGEPFLEAFLDAAQRADQEARVKALADSLCRASAEGHADGAVAFETNVIRALADFDERHAQMLRLLHERAVQNRARTRSMTDGPFFPELALRLIRRLPRTMSGPVFRAGYLWRLRRYFRPLLLTASPATTRGLLPLSNHDLDEVSVPALQSPWDSRPRQGPSLIAWIRDLVRSPVVDRGEVERPPVVARLLTSGVIRQLKPEPYEPTYILFVEAEPGVHSGGFRRVTHAITEFGSLVDDRLRAAAGLPTLKSTFSAELTERRLTETEIENHPFLGLGLRRTRPDDAKGASRHADGDDA